MKIVEINAYYNYGSTGHIAKDLFDEGRRSGHDMYAIYWLLYDERYDSDKVIFCGEKNPPSTVSKITNWIINGGRLKYNSQRTQIIINHINRINPDIIHIHNLHGDFEYGSIDFEMFFRAIALNGAKVIWTLHDCWPVTGRCYHFTYKKCNRWKSGCGQCPQRLFDREGILHDCSAENWRIKANLYGNINDLTIVTVSNWLNSVVRESMLKNRRIVTIYNGIDTDVFKPTNVSDDQTSFRILCVGWDRRKGYKDYYRLADKLSNGEKIIVVGKRPIFRRFKRLPKSIVEVNRVSSKEEMAAIYRSVDVYFNASPAETFGLTTVEALSCGIPVIGYKNTATHEILSIIDEGNYLVEDGSIQDVVAALKTIKTENVDRQEMHNKCCELFKYSNMLDSYMNLYREIGTKEAK